MVWDTYTLWKDLEDKFVPSFGNKKGSSDKQCRFFFFPFKQREQSERIVQRLQEYQLKPECNEVRCDTVPQARLVHIAQSSAGLEWSETRREHGSVQGLLLYMMSEHTPHQLPISTDLFWWFSNSAAHENHLEKLFKIHVPGPHPNRILINSEALGICFLFFF